MSQPFEPTVRQPLPLFDEPTMLQAMIALHGARKTPHALRPALVTHLLDLGLVAYTDIGWTLTAAGYRKLAEAADTPGGAAAARSLVDLRNLKDLRETGRTPDNEDRSRLIAREGAA